MKIRIAFWISELKFGEVLLSESQGESGIAVLQS